MVFIAAGCSRGNSARPGDSALSPAAEDMPALTRALEGIPGWKRTGPFERYNKEGLYGYIDGGAEIVLEYGFRDLAVFKFKQVAAPAALKEVVLEIYHMSSGEAAFGLYSSKLEGEEKGWPGVKSDNWISSGQANLVKGEYVANILAPECTEREIGEFTSALESKIPGSGTARPKGMDWLPREGMVPSSWHYAKGPLAARNESPFLEGEFWGFAGAAAGKGATEAYSAKYGAPPAVSKLVVVEFGRVPPASTIEDGVLGTFKEYLQGVTREGALIEGRNDAGRWFLFKRAGSIAALVLGDPDKAAAQTRLDGALARASGPLGASPAIRPKAFLVVTFDTEDYISPEAAHIDDIAQWLAGTMTEEGVAGTFFVIGEKARSLEKRGRRGVIAAMAKHDLGSHTNFGSIHSTVTELQLWTLKPARQG